MMPRSVSVVVPSYMGAEKLPALLDALAAQETDRDWEVVLVLDGSTDRSKEVAESYGARLRLTLVDLPTNQGRSIALNTGFEAASRDVVVRCDDDLVPSPDFVEKHALHHEESGDIGVVGVSRNVFPASAYARVYGIEADRRHWAEAAQSQPGARWKYWAANCSVLRDVWKQVGPYDVRYKGWGWEDVDWGYRLHRAGVEIVIDPEIVAEHHGVPETCRARVERAYMSGRAKSTFESIHGRMDTETGATLWSLLVESTGLPNAHWHRGFGRVLDWLIPWLPRSCARRMVALSVEAAAVGGLRSGRRR